MQEPVALAILAIYETYSVKDLTDFFPCGIKGFIDILKGHGTTNSHCARFFVYFNRLEASQIELDTILELSEARTIPVAPTSGKERNII